MTTEVQTTEIRTTDIRIVGMSCQHCVRAVRDALTGVPGVTAVEVDLDSGSARIQGSASALDLLHAVREAGYTAESAPG